MFTFVLIVYDCMWLCEYFLSNEIVYLSAWKSPWIPNSVCPTGDYINIFLQGYIDLLHIFHTYVIVLGLSLVI